MTKIPNEAIAAWVAYEPIGMSESAKQRHAFLSGFMAAKKLEPTVVETPLAQAEESDDVAFVERMVNDVCEAFVISRDIDNKGVKDIRVHMRVAVVKALARRASTKSETDGLYVDQIVRALKCLANKPSDYNELMAQGALQDAYIQLGKIYYAALARTPAAEARKGPLIARACLLQTRGQHPHTALPCTQCHFGPCEVCL